MVRRWSYLNASSYFSFKLLKKIKKKSNFFLFKTNIKFRRLKKLKIKFTKIKRKPFKRLKHNSFFKIYSNIFKFWSFDYKKMKFFFKYIYIHNLFANSYLIYNYNFLKNNNVNLYYNAPFLFNTQTKKINQFVLYSKFFTQNVNFISKTKPSFMYLFSPTSLNFNDEDNLFSLFPIFAFNYDLHNFPTLSINEELFQKSQTMLSEKEELNFFLLNKNEINFTLKYLNFFYIFFLLQYLSFIKLN